MVLAMVTASATVMVILATPDMHTLLDHMCHPIAFISVKLILPLSLKLKLAMVINMVMVTLATVMVPVTQLMATHHMADLSAMVKGILATLLVPTPMYLFTVSTSVKLILPLSLKLKLKLAMVINMVMVTLATAMVPVTQPMDTHHMADLLAMATGILATLLKPTPMYLSTVSTSVKLTPSQLLKQIPAMDTVMV